ncbi:MAG: hypothetical protein AABZ53_17840 [Planctomycetota bacterium]
MTMKLKGINVLEQHCEKIVVGVIGVGLVGVLGWQLLDQTKVKVGKGEPVPIQNAFEPVEAAAKRLISEMEQEKPEFPPSPDVSPHQGYSQSLAGTISPAGSLPAMGHAYALGGSSVAPTGDALYAMAAVPAPGKIFAATFRGTIDPMETINTKELAAFLPKEQPFDKASATIEAVFDGKALRAALEADPDGIGPISPLPVDWWLDKVEILRVVVEREEKSADGSWGNATTLATLPGRLDFMKSWDEKVKVGGDAINAVETARTRTQEILRPEFYDMIVGEWATASILTQREGSHSNPAEIRLMRDKIEELEKKLKDKEQELAQLPPDDKRPGVPPPPPPRRDPGGGGGGGRPGGGGGGRSPTPAPPEVKPELTPQAKRRAVQREIDVIKAELDRNKKRLSDMGGDAPTPVAPDGSDANPTLTNANLRLLDNGDVHIHAHDITVVPGTTYRYHVRVVMNNPIFGKDIMLKQGDLAQGELAKPSTVAGAWSEWSRDVEVDRDAYWFVTSTQSDALRQNPSTARAMLYKFYYGYYRRAEVSLEPGDALVGETKLPKLWIYDLEKLAAGPDGVAAPLPAPGGRNERDRGGIPQPPGPNSAEPPQPPNTQQAKDKLVFTDTATVLLMDVKPGSGPDDKSLAVLKTTEGDLITRSPEADKESPVYKRVNSSAEAGLLEAQPKVIAKPKPRPNQGPDEPSGPGGKGGGGGGGGKGGG